MFLILAVPSLQMGIFEKNIKLVLAAVFQPLDESLLSSLKSLPVTLNAEPNPVTITPFFGLIANKWKSENSRITVMTGP